MNSRLVNILIIASLGILLAAFCFKTRHHDTDLEILQQKLQPLTDKLPVTATVYFNCPSANLDAYMRVRYLLAPRTLIYTRDSTADTTLFLRPLNASMPAVAGNTAWAYTDSLFRYRLIINPH